MNEKIEKLKNWGCNVDKAIKRCVDDEELYLDCLQTFVSDENFALLGEKIAAKDADGAFGASHTIKGVAANLELQPILDANSGMLEKFRAGTVENTEADYQNFLKVFDEFKKIMA